MEETLLLTNGLQCYLLVVAANVLALVNDVVLKILVRKYFRYSYNITLTRQLLY